MKRIICDHCRHEVEPTTYGLPPAGWLSVDVRGTYTAPTDYCSVACAVAHVPTLTIPVAKEQVAA